MLARVNALRPATQTLATEFSMSRAEAQRQLGAMVLEGMLAHGFAIEDKRTERYAVSEAGNRMLADTAND